MTHAISLDPAVLDLAQDSRFSSKGERRRVQVGPRLAWALAIALVALLLAAQFATGTGLGRLGEMLGLSGPAQAEATIRVSLDQRREVASLTSDEPSQIVVLGQAAQERNALIPVSSAPLEHARSFLFAKAAPAAEGAYGNALTCLTQAVYYEAGFEPEAGKRAVAQVILNRMRHPAYPKSVCGVVYQGSERRTGCQFSFTCDGSLLRPASPGAWRDAQGVAKAALAGHVESEVGTATHYHADYVLPKWAFQLAKIEQIGAHIFYRFPGGWGRSAAFTGAYSGSERIPMIDYAALRARQQQGNIIDGSDGSADQLTPGLTVAPAVTDRHAENDVGGRINVTKLWRMSIPDPHEASSSYRATLEEQGVSDGPIPVSNGPASAQ